MTEKKRIEFNAEYRAKLSGLLPITSGVYQEDYTPEDFKTQGIPEEFWPVFTIQAMTAKERDESRASNEIGPEMINKYAEALGKKIKMWNNLYDLATGELIQFESGMLAERIKQYLTDYMIIKIYRRIQRISNLLEPEKLALR